METSTSQVESKDWYRSRGVVAGAVVVITILVRFFGYDLTDDDGAELGSSLFALFGAIGGIVAIYGRVKARGPIGRGGGNGAQPGPKYSEAPIEQHPDSASIRDRYGNPMNGGYVSRTQCLAMAIVSWTAVAILLAIAFFCIGCAGLDLSTLTDGKTARAIKRPDGEIEWVFEVNGGGSENPAESVEGK